MGNVFTTTCNGVCPELTTSEGQALFTLFGDTTVHGLTLAFFESPTSYRGGEVDWAIKSATPSAPVLASGTVNMTQWDLGPVNINGIPLEQYYENFSTDSGSGVSGVTLVAGNYYLDVGDHSSPPDQYGIFWATNSNGLAFTMEGTQTPSNQVPGVPEPSTLALVAAGLGAILFGARKSILRKTRAA